MKVKNIAIGIQSLEEGAEEFAQAIGRIQRGRKPKGRKEAVYFTSLEAMRKVLTPKRLQLLHVIRDRHPESVYGLAQLSGRDLKNVQQDVGLLARVGLVSLSRAKSRRYRLIPSVDYDRLQLHIRVM